MDTNENDAIPAVTESPHSPFNSNQSNSDRTIASPNSEQKLDVTRKKACSPSPPLLLLPSNSSSESNQLDSSVSPKSNTAENSLVLIETNDSGETSLIINFLKANFPSLNVQVRAASSKGPNRAGTNNNQENKSINQTNSRNCLSASYFSINDSRKANDRAASIDNSSLSSNSSSIDRQESKDSGFWSMSKNSFESMKSLSINDTINQNSEATATAALIPKTLNLNVFNLQKQEHQNLQHNQIVTNNIASNSNILSANQLVASNSFTNQSQNLNEATESSKFLTSPTSTKSSMLGWKKWKKGQTWRYNSSSNVSESDNTNDSTVNYNDSRSNSQNSSFISNNKSIDSDTLSVNSDNSYFKKTHEQIEKSHSLKVSNQNPILIQANAPHFSNSFESSKTSYITIPQPNLNNWSSTSKLESNISEYVEICHDQNTLKAQKRRGKLVRDRTIDNADEQSSSFSNSYCPSSPAKITDTIKKSSNDCNSFSYQKSNDASNSNSRLNDGGGTSPLSGNLALIKDELSSPNLSFTGRISPPEKRFSLSSHNILEHESATSNVLNDASVKKQPYLCNLSPEHQIQSQNLNLIVSHLLSNPRLLTKELRKQFSNQKNHMIQKNDTIIERDGSDSSSSSVIASEAVSPSQSSTSSISSNFLVYHPNASFSLSSSPKNNEVGISNYNSGLNIKHYDPYFYKDLQSKLNLKTNDSEDIEDSNNCYASTHSFNKQQNEQQSYLSKANQSNKINQTAPSPSGNTFFSNSMVKHNESLAKNNLLKTETKETKSQHQLLHRHHQHYHNHLHHHHHQKHSKDLSPITNRTNTKATVLPAFEFMAKPTETMPINKTNEHLSTVDKHLASMSSSSFDFKNSQVNNSDSNQPISHSCKIISRSNSSPSYSSSSSSSLTSPLSTQASTSPVSFPSYSSLLIPLNTSNMNNNNNNNNNNNTINMSSTNNSSTISNTSLTGSSGFIFKSFSCSLPISSNNNTNNNANIPSPTSSNSISTTPTAMNMNSNSFENQFSNFYSTNEKQNANYRNMLFSVKPPEIVITESKTENDQIDYVVDEPKKFSDFNRKKLESYRVQSENSSFESNTSKDENIYGIDNFLTNQSSSLKSNEESQSSLLDRNKNFYNNDINNLKYNEKESKILNMNNNNVNCNINEDNNVLDNVYQQKTTTNLSMFENWKLANSILNFNFLKTNNNNLTNPISVNNLNNVNSSNSTLNKSAKSIKPHICNICQKRFARSDMLIRHSRLHSGIRPYRCNRCGQEFSRSDHLNTHLRTHTGEKPYTCPYPKCTYAACRKDMITRHLKVHTKNKLSLSFDSSDRPNDNNNQQTSKLQSLSSVSFENTAKNFSTNNNAASFDFSLLTNQDFKNSTSQSKSTNSLISF